MIMDREIKLKNRTTLSLAINESGEYAEILFQINSGEECVLHWGLCRKPGLAWNAPPEISWPEGTINFGQGSVQTPFDSHNDFCSVSLKLPGDLQYSILVFAIYYPVLGKWDNNHGKNYTVSLPFKKAESSLRPVFEGLIKDRDVIYRSSVAIDVEYEILMAASKVEESFEVLIMSDMPQPLVLHWGAAVNSRYEWRHPDKACYPEGSVEYDDKAVQTPFEFSDNLNQLTLNFHEEGAPLGVPFVLMLKDESRWIKDGRKDFYISLGNGKDLLQELTGIADEIINGEMGDHGWTLMHRFNLCYDLLDEVRNDAKGLALIYIWMRYSAVRQLDWQRNYNTKPRELSHAQDRLTLKLSGFYASEQGSREIVRLIMSTLGRGGEGQKIRDEILHIMHRHHIKEVSGHFMEEWHQKLHNNTTPDDIVICQAYLEFLRSEGSLDRYYKTLEGSGVSKTRLESFDRPIVTEPDFVPHLKDALIHDFENYLKLLKSVHSGTDLESASNAAGYLMDSELGEVMSYIWSNRETGSDGVVDFAGALLRARQILEVRLENEQDAGKVRDMLFLDLALEEYMRIVIERVIHEDLGGDLLVELTGIVLSNVSMAFKSDELNICELEWKQLQGMERFTRDWALHAKASIDRISRAAGYVVDRYYGVFQASAEKMGRAFQAEPWAINLFTEEVVRGMPVFVLSLVVRHLDPLLRTYARLGDWQVISPGRTTGWIDVAESLKNVQGRRYDRPSIIVADRVRGDEEPPEGVTAIITPDSVDLVSHVAVRARNANLLFATCYDGACINQLKDLKGQMLDMNVNVSGDIEFKKSESAAPLTDKVQFNYEPQALPNFSAYTISSRQFNDELVGGKSSNLKKLEGAVPEWIRLPLAAALPFGVFDKVISLDINREVRRDYSNLIKRAGFEPESLLDIRGVILKLNAPEELVNTMSAVLDNAGIGVNDRWDDAWMCIKRVWASKWNERAFLSREARKIRHADIHMAVLVQEVIAAEYAFVIHTVNPFNKEKNELYAEVVPGLGETLVGNYPGRAFSYVSDKSSFRHEVIAYPSKSKAMYGGGVIFRSDSNAEDLPGYAGAGLYDSIMLDEPREEIIDYRQDRLVWDDRFRNEILMSISKIGAIIEDRFQSPQDIEGVYSGGNYYVVQTRPQV